MEAPGSRIQALCPEADPGRAARCRAATFGMRALLPDLECVERACSITIVACCSRENGRCSRVRYGIGPLTDAAPAPPQGSPRSGPSLEPMLRKLRKSWRATATQLEGATAQAMGRVGRGTA